MSDLRSPGESRSKLAVALMLGAFVVGLLGFRLPMEAASADAGLGGFSRATVVIGLVGKSQHALQKLTARLDAALERGPRSFGEISDVFESVLSAHVKIAQDLRTAFGLSHSGSTGSGEAGTDRSPAVPLAGAGGFYNATLTGFLALSERLTGIVDEFKGGIGTSDAERYGEELLNARSMVTSTRRIPRALP